MMPPSQASPTTRRLERLGPAACLRLLASRYLGRVAYIAEGRPHVIPLNYVLDGDTIVVRMDYGRALEQVAASRGVAFEVDHADFAYHTGWSVVAHGDAEVVTTPGEVERLRLLPLRPWAPGDRAQYVRITPTTFTGRRIT
jgi:uncharacterized protein